MNPFAFELIPEEFGTVTANSTSDMVHTIGKSFSTLKRKYKKSKGSEKGRRNEYDDDDKVDLKSVMSESDAEYDAIRTPRKQENPAVSKNAKTVDSEVGFHKVLTSDERPNLKMFDYDSKGALRGIDIQSINDDSLSNAVTHEMMKIFNYDKDGLEKQTTNVPIGCDKLYVPNQLYNDDNVAITQHKPTAIFKIKGDIKSAFSRLMRPLSSSKGTLNRTAIKDTSPVSQRGGKHIESKSGKQSKSPSPSKKWNRTIRKSNKIFITPPDDFTIREDLSLKHKRTGKQISRLNLKRFSALLKNKKKSEPSSNEEPGSYTKYLPVYSEGPRPARSDVAAISRNVYLDVNALFIKSRFADKEDVKLHTIECMRPSKSETVLTKQSDRVSEPARPTPSHDNIDGGISSGRVAQNWVWKQLHHKGPNILDSRYEDLNNLTYCKVAGMHNPKFEVTLLVKSRDAESETGLSKHHKTLVLTATLKAFFFPTTSVNVRWVHDVQDEIEQLVSNNFIQKFGGLYGVWQYSAVLVLSSSAGVLVRHPSLAFLRSIVSVLGISLGRLLIMTKPEPIEFYRKDFEEHRVNVEKHDIDVERYAHEYKY